MGANTSGCARQATATRGSQSLARAYLASIFTPEIGHGSDAATLYSACRVARVLSHVLSRCREIPPGMGGRPIRLDTRVGHTQSCHGRTR
jgi:hypothetical protein